MLKDLDEAIEAGDQQAATILELAILRFLAAEAAEREELERSVRARVARLGGGRSTVPSLPRPQDLFTHRGPAYLSGEPAEPAATVRKGILYPVWFATNRLAASSGTGFQAEGRSAHVNWGRVDVHVPETHRFGETGSSYWQRMWRQYSLRPADDHLRIEAYARLSEAAFYEAVRQELASAQAAGAEPHALVFLHGYNTSFEEAAIRAAQIGCDLKVAGATAFFSWPSAGSVQAYPADEAAIEASERAITDFLVAFATECGTAKVHLVAHSMGNRGLLRALQRIAGNAETRNQVRFGQIFLAAPDVDHDLFLDLAALYPAYGERTTLYTSRHDRAVHASARLHRAPRAGYYEPYTIAPHIDTIAVPDFDLDLLGHGYFAQAAALLHDLYDLMRHNQPPGQRQRLQHPSLPDGGFWQLQL
ncbi:hypothetical protein GCM10011378_39370 [Hymenobacter glacieicola]|uniref:Alpha/beta hydrolase n=1 Tax=Hymenobacter glacieicola TaxID=1562124 RepID=A0ABQ1X5B0_9BACT|nr:hypothetical protein GCM10011378_39370 [Hymenobacter glacieicola]